MTTASKRMKIELLIPVFLSAAGLAGSACGSDDSGAEMSSDDLTIVREDMPHEVAALIDAGNAAFSSGDLETARRHYLGAAVRDSSVAAAWYGLAMTERALGNDAGADSALERVRGLGGPAAIHHPAAPDSADRSPHSQPGAPHGPPHPVPQEPDSGEP